MNHPVRVALSGIGVAALVCASTPGIAIPSQEIARKQTAVVDAAACSQNVLPRNDDNSTTNVDLPFSVNFYGESFSSLWVNNNGNVTFDAKQRTYTPYGLTSTERSIIAPFFGDVDTRPAGTDPVTFGWGETTYEGHRAFCVNWLNVGYYKNRSDKTNSFQLLLVEREDSNEGDFDIVFNYDRIQWETGEASRGRNGIGGKTARVGFSNGTGENGTFFEMPGSGQSGSFLDGGPRSLVKNKLGSDIPGRYIWKVRSGSAPTTKYVALGDSYQSGRGTYPYHPSTDTESNRCHRSKKAYPQLLVDRGVVNAELEFWACANATIPKLYEKSTSDSDAPWDDPKRAQHTDKQPELEELKSQLDRLDNSVSLVTVGIGGNDVGFGHFLQNCLTRGVLTFNDDQQSSCRAAYGGAVLSNIAYLQPQLKGLFKDIKQRAPYARVLVTGYPRFFPENGAEKTFRACNTISVSNQLWINNSIQALNTAIQNSAWQAGVEYVDVYTSSEGHEICSSAHSTELEFMSGLTKENGRTDESFHPREFGHIKMAQRFSAQLSSQSPGKLSQVMPGERVSLTANVTGNSSAYFNNSWPGSDVVMTLTSPSGRKISRKTSAEDVTHEVGPTFERYEVRSPEAGKWKVELFGKQVARNGEPSTFNLHQDPPRNEAPDAVAKYSQSGTTVSVDATRSVDSDGEIVDYLWDFGDGATASGSKATHTYTKPGTYEVRLVVTDGAGSRGFGVADRPVVISESATDSPSEEPSPTPSSKPSPSPSEAPTPSPSPSLSSKGHKCASRVSFELEVTSDDHGQLLMTGWVKAVGNFVLNAS